MTFREITITELPNFIASDFYKNSKVIPISPQRAISQHNNPNSKPTDVALILALDKEEEIIGYIGILPGKINSNDTPYFWNSCWWVDGGKGKLAAMPLFYKMLKISNKNMLFFELTATTKNIVSKFNFKTETTEGFKGFFKFNFAEILPRRNKVFTVLKPLLELFDWKWNLLMSYKLRPYQNLENIKIVAIQDIGDEAENFIRNFNNTQLIPTNKKELNWIIQYPWIIDNPTPEDETLAKRYFFSSISKSFSNNLYKVYKNDQLIAVLFFTIRDNEMKLPYAYFESENVNEVASSIYHIAIKNKATSFISYNSVLINHIKSNKNPFVFTKPLHKNIAYPADLNVNSSMLQDGDGDAVFC